MINQYEVPAYLVDELPEIENIFKTTMPTLNIFKTIQCLVTYTKNCVRLHDMNAVKKAMDIAENIYMKGNKTVKDAIENVFVYSFTSIFCMCERKEQAELHTIMPLHLYSAYVLQIYRSLK